MQKIKNFLNEVQGELKKVSWPPKQELKESTLMVIISGVLLAFYVGVVDFVLKIVLALVIR